MGLPNEIRVRLSSEDAGAVSLTAVVVETLPAAELLRLILAGAGKDPARVAAVLARGSLVSGLTRYRWEPLHLTPADLSAVLAAFPDSDPALPFRPRHAMRIVLAGVSARVEVRREHGAQRRFLRRRSFWQQLLAAVEGAAPAYVAYQYREGADLYRLGLTPALHAAVRDAAGLLRFSTLAEHIRTGCFDHIDFFVARSR